ncbi:UDP-2,3-diacylglucosamine diphosphatase LpxI [Selenomonas sp. TAMA-11512]|uniref:LpxI family protein n=1 Tax=Selenomonas sp. TAMA-11512 TaxID=3095337 RepID=UPI003090EE5A|nr:UDP-2,3-diacylglucosamine diphosphatase LpxI [Selenomonas sp. TAMA-11512]
MKKIGLLAGVGDLPVACAQAARGLGIEVVAVSLLDDTNPALSKAASVHKSINVARLGEVIAFLKENGVEEVTMLGKVTKEILFQGAHAAPDALTMQILASLPNKQDDTIMLAFVGALAQAGLKAFDQTALIKALMPGAGVLTKRSPDEAERKDMEFALSMAKEIGRLDIGQTAVVKGGAVMALEAIEGTDACIERGGKLARGNAIVGKAAKPAQDMRFDVPAIGEDTIRSMIAADAKGLAIEAGCVLVVNQAAVVELADANGISIAAI